MADDSEPQNAITSTFPPPPPFWRDFTPDNVARIADLRQEQIEREGIVDGKTVRLTGLPENLRNLQPPPEPTSGAWRVFGQNYALEEELPRLDNGTGIRKLFPDPEERDQDGKHFDRATILKRLAKSLLPHQARESLISMMQAQLDRTRAETNTIRDVKEKVERMLEGLGSLKMEDMPNGLGEAKHLIGDHDPVLDDTIEMEFV
ncbi:Mediator of RNA polymerase II transcription subunit 7 [Pestalotiopsis sp. 9143b]|nr:Mediator of RNA polymerase II transcription subunit 7 [Pestalotiopsis sp. 9143b]